jgi:hypothetical protein
VTPGLDAIKRTSESFQRHLAALVVELFRLARPAVETRTAIAQAAAREERLRLRTLLGGRGVRRCDQSDEGAVRPRS